MVTFIKQYLFFVVLCLSLAPSLCSDEARADREKLREVGAHLKQVNLSEWRRAYKIYLCCDFLNMPNQENFELAFQKEFDEVIQHKFPNLFQMNWVKNQALGQQILKGEIANNYLDKFSKSNANIWISLQVHAYEKYISVRRYKHSIKDYSTLIVRRYNNALDLVDIMAEIIPDIFGVEGMIVKIGDEYNLILRGDGTSVSRLHGLQSSTFAIFRNEQKIFDSFVTVEKMLYSDVLSVAVVKVLGEYRPRSFDTVHQIFFSGGKQKFQLLDNNGNPQEGFSIFVSDEKFSEANEHYQTTTDISGEFTLVDEKKIPLFLTVAKNMEQVNFAVLRKCIIVSSPADPIIFTVETLEDLKVNPKGGLSSSEIQKIKNNIIERIIQAKKYMQNNEHEKAVIALLYAKKTLHAIPEEESLKETINQLKSIYNQALKQKEIDQNKKQCIEYIEKTDELVSQQKLTEALQVISKAENVWTKNSTEDFIYQEIIKRKDRIDILILQEKTPIGVARTFLSLDVFSMTVENIDVQKITKINQMIQILLREIGKNNNSIYGDDHILLKIKPFLDTLAHSFIKDALYYLEEYKNTESATKRRDVYERYEKYYNYSKKFDEILVLLQKI